jgi:lysophospholipase L1-like esterase
VTKAKLKISVKSKIIYGLSIMLLLSNFFSGTLLATYYPNTRHYKPGCASTALDEVRGEDVTIIGDSITVGSTPDLEDKLSGVEINAVVGRQFASSGSIDPATGRADPGGVEVARSMSLRQYVVFALGTNSASLTRDQVRSAVDVIGGDKKIILVTNYDSRNPITYASNNALINDAPRNWSNVSVADWASAAGRNPVLYVSTDGVHPTAEGQKLFAETIVAALEPAAAGAQGGGGTINGGRNYAGDEIFNEAQLEAIRANQPFYEEAAQQAGIPWQMLVAIHNLEHGLARDNPSNGQGVYQDYARSGNGGVNYPPGPITDEEFQRQTNWAAGFLRNKAGSRADDLSSGDEAAIKYTFFAYNGTADVYKRQALNMGFTQEEADIGEGSPYVMNRFDEQRDPTKGAGRPNWGQILTDGGGISYPANSHFGAFTQYASIAGLGGSGTCGQQQTDGSINATALLYSWPPGDSHVGTFNPKDEYVEGMQNVNLNGAYADGAGGYCTRLRSDGNSDGASCDVFVATVYRNTVDPEFPCCGTNNMLVQLRDSPFADRYEEIQANGDYGNLQPGDIMLANGHIMMYVKLADGTFKIASASCGSRTADHAGDPSVYAHGSEFYDNYGSGGAQRTYHVFRWKGGS